MNSKLRFLLISLFIFFVAALQASADGDIRVSGVVMSEGEPLPCLLYTSDAADEL